jgi:hypothetical protein
MDEGGGFERWGGDVDFNDLAAGGPDASESPQWEPTPPPRWSGRRIGLIVAGAVLATVAGVGGVLGVMRLVRSDETGSVTGDPAATSETSGDVVVLPSELDWYAVDGTLGFARRVASAPDGAFYALSTAPGPAIDWPPPQAIYSSVDGENWDFVVLADDIGGKDMAIRGDTVYLIGTAPGFGGFGEPPVVVINSSRDGGSSWDQVPLPTAAVPPPNAGDVGWTEISMHIASSTAGVVAVVQTNFWIDFWQLVPEEILVGEVDVRPTEEGVRVIDYSIVFQLEQQCEAEGGFPEGDADLETVPESCRKLMTGDIEESVVATLTWEELGLEDGQPVFSEVFYSVDGQAWEAVESPFAAGQLLASLHATADGFVASQWSEVGGNTIWYSPDGRTWEDTSLAGFEWIVAAGSVQGQDVILGNARGRAVVAWADGSGGWTEVDLSNEVVGIDGSSWIGAGAVGPLGVIALLNSEGADGVQPSRPMLLHGTSLDEWNTIPLDTLTGGGWGYSDWAAVGREQVLVRYVEGGGPRDVNLQLVGLTG